MRKERRKLRNKPYFCYDVNQEFHTLLKECNKYALFISSVQVTKNPEALDQRILRMCNKLDYHVVTHNKGDFVPTKITKIGLILVGLATEESFIPKFTKLFSFKT